MLLEGVFPMLGGVGTAAALLSILTAIGVPVVGELVCPMHHRRRMAARGR